MMISKWVRDGSDRPGCAVPFMTLYYETKLNTFSDYEKGQAFVGFFSSFIDSYLKR